MEIGNKYIERKVGDKLHIYFVGDVHEGNVNYNRRAFARAVDIIANDDDARVILMGDLIEAINIHDKRFDPIAIAKEYEIRDLKDLAWRQMSRVIEAMKPIADKIDAILIGNHEEYYVKTTSSDVYARLCEQFPNAKKLGYVGFFVYRINVRGEKKRQRKLADYHIRLALNHGTGGSGYLEGYPVNIVHKTYKWMRADVNVMGHIHKLYEDRKQIVSVSPHGKLIKQIMFWGVSGCFLNSYVEGNRNYYEHKAGWSGESDVGMLMLDVELHRDFWRGKMKKIYLE